MDLPAIYLWYISYSSLVKLTLSDFDFSNSELWAELFTTKPKLFSPPTSIIEFSFAVISPLLFNLRSVSSFPLSFPASNFCSVSPTQAPILDFAFFPNVIFPFNSTVLVPANEPRVDILLPSLSFTYVSFHVLVVLSFTDSVISFPSFLCALSFDL